VSLKIAHYQIEPLPFDDMTLGEVVKEVLGARGPMRQTELVVAMMEAGYQTTMQPQGLRDAVGNVLRKDDGPFQHSGGKWIVA